jgi:diguanylate cyclase (GGDEF)-like protein
MHGSDIADRYSVRASLNGRQRTPFQTGCRVLAAGAVAGALIVAFVLIAITPLTAGQRRARQIVRDDLSLQRQCAQLRGSLSGWAGFLEPELDAIRVPGAKPVPTDIAKGSQLAQAQIDQAKALASGLRTYGLTVEARALDAAMSTFIAAFTELTPVAAGEDVTASEFTRVVNAERAAFTRVWDVTTSIDQQVRQHLTAPDVQYVTHKFDVARTIMVVFGTLALSLSLGAASVFARRAARRERTRREVAQRTAYGTDLQQALELAKTETAVYGVVSRALREAVPELNVELLIADSSRAHFSRVLASSPDPEHADGCGVVSPNDCPATTRGHTMLFASSDALSACPYLEDRASGSCSAVCIPVSMAGHTVGVMHATGTNNTLPPAGDLDNLELSARRAAERIALLRTFQRSETQARTDPLTGLLNRRSLENQVRDLQSDGISYALAYGDLDHFKALNDTHGHETGDQALRLFARVMRDSVRPADLVSRYGGEEFVIVLPDCATNTATAVLERIREHLALSLTSGRVPPFTVSFGLATSTDATTFDEIVDVADHALLNAKAAGRNRVVLAASD